jgi:predicted enzyme related to lactoylglutathione lyase
VTVGLPVSDLGHALGWYRDVFGLGEPDLAPADGVLEFQVGPVWLQLSVAPVAPAAPVAPVTAVVAGTVKRFGVADAGAERSRLAGLGVAVGPLEHVPGAVDYFDFTDPDGNRLSLYSFPSP